MERETGFEPATSSLASLPSRSRGVENEPLLISFAQEFF